MYAWKTGLKSGVYYTRTKSKIENNSKLSSGSSNEVQKKPENTQFECFGCSS
jgi:ribonucleotide reductase alpha subunit